MTNFLVFSWRSYEEGGGMCDCIGRAETYEDAFNLLSSECDAWADVAQIVCLIDDPWKQDLHRNCKNSVPQGQWIKDHKNERLFESNKRT